MVFNPTSTSISRNLTLPLYYTGLDTMASVSQEGQAAKQYTLARDYSITLALDMKPQSITWFLIKAA